MAFVTRSGSAADVPDDPGAARAFAAQSPAHAIALARAELAWDTAGRLRAAPPVLEPEAIAGPAGRVEALFDRRGVMAGLIAASLVGGVAVVAVQKASAVDRYRTRIGEQRRVTLADGSRIDLNTATSVEVSIDHHRRVVHLLAGEALFDVAHDPARPFLVQAGGTTLRALGTAFNVRIREQLVELTVTRGSVGIVGDGIDDGQPLQPVAAGSGAAIRPGMAALSTIGAAAVEQRTAWQGGVIELDGETLAQAVEEFNRYRTRPLVIGDPRLASIRIGGRFATRDSAKFIDALQQSFAIRAVSGPDRSILLVAAQ